MYTLNIKIIQMADSNRIVYTQYKFITVETE